MADELISRQAVIAKAFEDMEAFRAAQFQEWLDELSSVDAVPVVRCGTPCRWLYDEPDDYCCMNHKGLVQITPDSFCSYGVRREESEKEN